MARVKTWGYLLAIESEREIDPAVIEDIVSQVLDDPHYDKFAVNSLECESMGEIDCYEGQETK